MTIFNRLTAGIAAVCVGLTGLGMTAASAASSRPIGPDVSTYQAVGTIKKGKGYSFAMIKATQSNWTDSKFSGHWKTATDAGLIRGAYHFIDPKSSSGSTQAKFFVQHGGGWKADGRTLPGALDLEDNPQGSHCHGLSRAEMQKWVRDFTTTYKSLTGRSPMIYSTASYMNACLQNPAEFSDSPLWVAHWGVQTPKVPAGMSYTFHQYSTTNNTLDMNVFNGSQAQLEALAWGGKKPTTTKSTAKPSVTAKPSTTATSKQKATATATPAKPSGKASASAAKSPAGKPTKAPETSKPSKVAETGKPSKVAETAKPTKVASSTSTASPSTKDKKPAKPETPKASEPKKDQPQSPKPIEHKSAKPTPAPTAPSKAKSEDPKNDPKNAPADPKNAPADPKNAPADPKNAPADPKNAPADPKNAPADPKNQPKKSDAPVVVEDSENSSPLDPNASETTVDDRVEGPGEAPNLPAEPPMTDAPKAEPVTKPTTPASHKPAENQVGAPKIDAPADPQAPADSTDSSDDPSSETAGPQTDSGDPKNEAGDPKNEAGDPKNEAGDPKNAPAELPANNGQPETSAESAPSEGPVTPLEPGGPNLDDPAYGPADTGSNRESADGAANPQLVSDPRSLAGAAVAVPIVACLALIGAGVAVITQQRKRGTDF